MKGNKQGYSHPQDHLNTNYALDTEMSMVSSRNTDIYENNNPFAAHEPIPHHIFIEQQKMMNQYPSMSYPQFEPVGQHHHQVLNPPQLH